MSNQTLSYTFRGNDDTVTTALPVTTKTANYTVSVSDDVGREFTFDTSTSDLTASLPTASTAGNGFNVILRNIGTGVLTIDPSGTETIDGELTENVPADQVRWIRSDGLSWRSVVGIDASTPTLAENLLINGGFDIWQRGTSFTATGYTADRWRADEGAGAFTVSRQSFVLGQTDVFGEPEFFLECDMSSGSASAPSLEQRVEGVRTLSGVTASLSFYAKVASGTISVTPRLRQNFGTGGSPSTEVDTDGSNITVTSSWQLFEITLDVPSISGKTLGADDNDYLSVMFVLPTSSIFTVSIARAKLEAGDVATAFVSSTFSDEIALCQQYYIKTFLYDVVPVQNSNNYNGALRTYATTPHMEPVISWTLPVALRKTPAGTGGGTEVTLYTVKNTGAAAQWSNTGNILANARSVQNSEIMINIDNTTFNVTISGQWFIHVVVDVEL